MAHPFSHLRERHQGHGRVGHITKGYASGGRVSEAEHKDEKQDRKLIKKVLSERDAKAVEGSKAKERQDRPGRARGGRSPKHKGKGNNVNVIVAPQHSGLAAPPMLPGGGAGVGASPPAPMPAPRPPMAPGAGPASPGGLPPGGMPPGMMPPGGPIRRHGGRAFAAGGAVQSGPGWKTSEQTKTPVQHSPGKNDQANVGRGKPITYATGGPVEAPKGKAGMAPKVGAGGKSGVARLRKAHHGIKGGMAL